MSLSETVIKTYLFFLPLYVYAWTAWLLKTSDELNTFILLRYYLLVLKCICLVTQKSCRVNQHKLGLGFTFTDAETVKGLSLPSRRLPVPLQKPIYSFGPTEWVYLVPQTSKFSLVKKRLDLEWDRCYWRELELVGPVLVLPSFCLPLISSSLILFLV